MTTAAVLGTSLVKIILLATAAWLYWKAVNWTARSLAIADLRAQERQRQTTLLQIADYLESKNLASIHRQEERAFDLDDEDLSFRLRRSIEITRPNDAA